MKRYLVLALLVLTLGVLAAVESAPSETVGYFKIGKLAPDGSIIPIEPDSWIPVSIPFGLTADGPNNILGNQFGYEDQLVDPYNDYVANCYAPEGWFCVQDDSLMMLPGHFYWVYRNPYDTNFNFYLTGKVDPQPFTLNMKGQDSGGWTPFALNEAVPIDAADLGITTLNYEDYIVDVLDNSNATYYGDDGWYSDLGEPGYLLKPTHAYYYYSNNATGFSWTYVPAGSVRNITPLTNKESIRSKR